MGKRLIHLAVANRNAERIAQLVEAGEDVNEVEVYVNYYK